jgi:dienelactone hydrolase
MAPERAIQVPVGGRDLDVYLALPEQLCAGGQHPAVIVVHEIFGADAHIRAVAQRISSLGYVAAAPNLFPADLMKVLTPENIQLAMASLAQAPRNYGGTRRG